MQSLPALPAAAAAGLCCRGEGSFGILAYGACGYTNEGGALPFPRTQVRRAPKLGQQLCDSMPLPASQ
jgi:hypothetical protein